MNINNQYDYWDRVAAQKTFTHPLQLPLLLQYVTKQATIIDYGCGYGRVVAELLNHQFEKVRGYDTSIELVKRGLAQSLPLHYIATSVMLPLDKNSIDCFLLFAVLTCIPSNAGQSELLQLLHSKLRPGGYIYISDYYLQENEKAISRYECLNNDPDNYGVFTLPEEATLRHHPREWINKLVAEFTLLHHEEIDVNTMNGNGARAFQLVLQK